MSHNQQSERAVNLTAPNLLNLAILILPSLAYWLLSSSASACDHKTGAVASCITSAYSHVRTWTRTLCVYTFPTSSPAVSLQSHWHFSKPIRRLPWLKGKAQGSLGESRPMPLALSKGQVSLKHLTTECLIKVGGRYVAQIYKLLRRKSERTKPPNLTWEIHKASDIICMGKNWYGKGWGT